MVKDAANENEARTTALRLATRGCYLTTVELYRLDLACTDLWRFTHEQEGVGGVYLVGSATDRADFRDVDVRMILDDGDFDRMFASPALWGLFCYAVSRQLADDTGLPVDFQVQRRTEANEKYSGGRNALGMVARGARDFAGLGDATNYYQVAASSPGAAE